MAEPTRVLFTLPFLSRIGGAERVVLTLLQHLDRSRFEAALAVLDGSRNELASDLPADVTLIDLGVSRARQAARPLIAAMRQWRPQVLFSNLGHLNLMIAILRPLLPGGVAVVGRETTVVTRHHAGFRTGPLRNAAYRWFYPRLDLVVCQSEGMREDLEGPLAFPRERLRLIPNPVDVARLKARAAEAPPDLDLVFPPPAQAHASRQRLRLVAIGRLSPEKGFDLLIDAVARLPRGQVELAILGEGAEREALANRIRALGLDDDIRLLGFQANPPAFLARADALVLSSRHEGLPNVVLEALALERPVIATPAPGGLADIVHNSGGIRVASDISAPALATEIAAFAADPVRAIGDVSPYGAERITRRYEDVLTEAVALARRRRHRA